MQQITLKKAGSHCKRCNREMKIGWKAMYSPDEKTIYCMPCSEELGSVNPESKKQVASINPPTLLKPDNTKIVIDTVTGMSALLDKEITELSLKIDVLGGSITAISQMIGDVNTHIAALIIQKTPKAK